MIRLTISSPSPEPLDFVVKYGSKTRLRFSAEIPPPVSVKLIFTWVSSRSVRMRKNAAALHRFEAVFDRIVEDLFHLVAIELERRQIGAQLGLDDDVAVFYFRLEKSHRFFDERVHVLGMKLRLRWPDRAQKLRHDRVEPTDLRARDVDRFLKLTLVLRRRSVCAPFAPLIADGCGAS